MIQTFGNIRFIHGDCMDFMRDLPEKAYSLAIVDPPYGIHDKISKGGGSHTKSKSKFHQMYAENNKKWDMNQPPKEYWQEIFRTTKNQIVFGANYFCKYLPISRGWIFWDKMGENMTTVNNEIIFTSYDVSIATFRRCHGLDKGFMNKERKNIHPTQKPIALYTWLLQNYAKPGDTILDTHLGSGSSAIAAYRLGFDFTGIELDKDYYDASVERFKKETLQTSWLIPKVEEDKPVQSELF